MSEDVVNRPSHYAEGWSNGAEVIDITEHLNFNRGNAVKYIARAGKKNPEKELEDLQKAEFSLKREIQRIAQRWDNPPTYQVVAEPRVWENIRDVPADVVVVTSNPVLQFHWHGGKLFYHWTDYDSRGEETCVDTANLNFTPFTEVLEARPPQEETE